jgi:ABC-type polysaccharide/polyol phosphate export permease
LLYVLNPLSAIVEGFRAVLVFDRAPDWTLTLVSTVMTLSLVVGAFLMYKRLDKYFADVI